MNLVDTHSHIHDAQYDWPAGVVENAKKAGVTQIVTVGTDVDDSRAAIKFAKAHDGVFATVGIHPGIEGPQDIYELEKIIIDNSPIGLGDIGLDYHYQPFDRDSQIELLESQLDLAQKYDLPVQFHVREAYDDFWPILDNFPKIRGTLHSYTDNLANMEKGLSRRLYISVNGIVSFNHDPELNQVYKQIPLDRLLFETDAPYLAPKPHRGKTNQPAYVVEIARHWSKTHNMEFDEVASVTTDNARKLFSLLSSRNKP